jgi:tRNA-splicing ligase RtcB
MRFCIRFAFVNRLRLAMKTIEIMNYFCEGEIASSHERIDCSHNLAEYDHPSDMWVHRKGATTARSYTRAAIPANRAEGIFIVEGKGNAQSLFSCSHGAGRVESRTWCKQNLNYDKSLDQMRGIEAINHPTLIDESPNAYKNISKVMMSQTSLLKIVGVIKPLINFKDIRKLTPEEAFTAEDNDEPSD